MGGTSYDSKLPAMQLGMESAAAARAQATQNKMLELLSSIPQETWTPDMYGPAGFQNKAAAAQAVNEYLTKKHEQEQNPEAAKAREIIQRSALESVSPDFWQKQMNEWAKTKGLEDYISRGAEGGFAQSAFADEATPAGQAFRAQNLALAQGIIGQPTPVGIDPSQAISALQNAEAQAMQQRAGLRSSIFGEAQKVGQSATDWINQMMGSTSQAVGQFEQARAQAAQQKNTMIAAGINAVSNIGGQIASAYAGKPPIPQSPAGGGMS